MSVRFVRASLVCVLVALLSGCATRSTPKPPAPRVIAGPQAPAPVSPVPAPVVPAPPLPPVVQPPIGAETPKPVVPPTPAAPGVPPKRIALHFDDADLEQVLRALSSLAGINFVLAQGVKVKVTIHVDSLEPTDAFGILEAILEANNLTAIKSGLLYKIVPVAAAGQQPAPLGMGAELAADEGFLTQIVPLKYLSADDLVKSLQPLVAPNKILAYRETNSVVVSGSASMLRRVLEVIRSLDVAGQQRDVEQIFVYSVENAKAAELATVLSGLFGSQAPGPRAVGPRPSREPTGVFGAATPFGAAAPAVPPPPPPKPGISGLPPPGPPGPGGPPSAPPAPEEARVVGEIRIVPDERTNSLLVRATPQDYRLIEQTIRKLDIMPKQVVIEVLLAELTLTDRFQFGLEQFLQLGDVAVQQFFGLGPLPQSLIRGAATNTPGFTLTFVDRDRFRLFLNTLSAYTKVDTVATPHILTQDNREARIQVGQEVPIVTGEVGTLPVLGQQGGGATPVFRTIQQRDVGRILVIKPHVNEKRQVALEIQLEATDVLPSSTVAGTPSFNKRTAQTSVVVSDGQSLLLGGIISEVKQNELTGIPLLSRIPVLGWLFGTRAKSLDRTELLILLTPHVIADPEQGRALTEQFKKRLEWFEDYHRLPSPDRRVN